MGSVLKGEQRERETRRQGIGKAFLGGERHVSGEGCLEEGGKGFVGSGTAKRTCDYIINFYQNNFSSSLSYQLPSILYSDYNSNLLTRFHPQHHLLDQATGPPPEQVPKPFL